MSGLNPPPGGGFIAGSVGFGKSQLYADVQIVAPVEAVSDECAACQLGECVDKRCACVLCEIPDEEYAVDTGRWSMPRWFNAQEHTADQEPTSVLAGGAW